MEIRRYRPGEEEAAWEVVFQATRISNARDYHPDQIERWTPLDKDMNEWRQRLADRDSFVAILDGRVAGLAEVNADGFVDYFYVHPEFQGRGVGKAMMAKLEAEARVFGVERIYPNVSVTAKTFFEAQGWVVTETKSNVVLGHPAPNFVMAKELG